MIRYSVPEGKQKILDIFNICFAGEENFAKWFFERVYDSENTLVYENDGEVIAALQMLPVTLTDGERQYSAAYLYGVGTLPQWRGKGIMAQLINHSFEEMRKIGIDFSILIVQEQSLLEYYKRFGFVKYFSVGVSEQEGDISAPVSFRPIAKSDLMGIDKVYNRCCHGLYAVRDVKHYENLFDMYAETAFVCETDGEIDSYVFGYFTENTFNATEAMGHRSLELAHSVALFHNKKQVRCTFPGSDKFIGMIREINTPVKDIEGYINLLYN